MSSAWKAVKKGASSIAGTVKGAAKGDLGDIASVLTLGATDQIERAASATADMVLPDMPDIPEPADINMPDPAGTAPGAIGRTVPNVDLSGTEGQRRTSGSAKGSRKLRVPLGGLGR